MGLGLVAELLGLAAGVGDQVLGRRGRLGHPAVGLLAGLEGQLFGLLGRHLQQARDGRRGVRGRADDEVLGRAGHGGGRLGAQRAQFDIAAVELGAQTGDLRVASLELAAEELRLVAAGGQGPDLLVATLDLATQVLGLAPELLGLGAGLLGLGAKAVQLRAQAIGLADDALALAAHGLELAVAGLELAAEVGDLGVLVLDLAAETVRIPAVDGGTRLQRLDLSLEGVVLLGQLGERGLDLVDEVVHVDGFVAVAPSQVEARVSHLFDGQGHRSPHVIGSGGRAGTGTTGPSGYSNAHRLTKIARRGAVRRRRRSRAAGASTGRCRAPGNPRRRRPRRRGSGG